MNVEMRGTNADAMPYNLLLTQRLRVARWKVKIFDGERLETPHVTIIRGLRRWRLSLRDGTFLDSGDGWSEIDGDVRQIIEDEWNVLIAEWNVRYGDTNPV